MLRRSHKKSWGGCHQCKRRHVKCDESRPICLLCTRSGRECSFASQSPEESRSTSHKSAHKRTSHPGHTQSQEGALLPDISPLTAAFLSNPDLSQSTNTSNDQGLSFDEVINFNHMELVAHMTLDKKMFNLGTSVSDYSSTISLALNMGYKSPYLLYQLLAYSARHLAFLHPERSAFYLHQAVTLQTRAVSLFNAAWTEVNQSNCVAIILFSTVLGHHLLADTLAKRDHGGLEAFMTQCMQCVNMHRGIRTAIFTAWPLLMESELEPIMSMSKGLTSRSPRGNHCWQLRELVNNADGLEEKVKEGCRYAIRYLQIGFDAILAEEEKEGTRYEMMFLWILLMPPEFASLLATNRPEALILLAYYALLLHHGRSRWQIGDSGAYVLELITGYLGPEWDQWLEYPRDQISRDLR